MPRASRFRKLLHACYILRSFFDTEDGSNMCFRNINNSLATRYHIPNVSTFHIHGCEIFKFKTANKMKVVTHNTLISLLFVNFLTFAWHTRPFRSCVFCRFHGRSCYREWSVLQLLIWLVEMDGTNLSPVYFSDTLKYLRHFKCRLLQIIWGISQLRKARWLLLCVKFYRYYFPLHYYFRYTTYI